MALGELLGLVVDAMLGKALGTGVIGLAQNRVLDLLATVRTPATAEVFARDEQLLVDQAATLRFSAFTKAVKYWHQLADPDGTDRDAESQREGRGLHWSQSIGGMWFGKVTGDPIGGTIVHDEVARLEQQLYHQEQREGAITRTGAQRRFDALVEMATRSRTAPAQGKRPAPLFTVLVGYETFHGRICELTNGTVIAPGALVRWLDEAYVELSASPVPQSRAQEIKGRIREATHLICSIGLAPNKLMAKIASDLDKPDGFFVLDHDNWLETVGEKPASLLPGVGPKTFARLRGIGIETVAQLSQTDELTLGRAFGPNHGAGLLARANGIGSTKLNEDRVRKSESRETTFPEDITDRQVLHDTVERLARSVCESLAQNKRRGRTVTLKIRLQPFKTYTRSRTLSSHTCDADQVVATARELLDRFDPQLPVDHGDGDRLPVVAQGDHGPTGEGLVRDAQLPGAQGATAGDAVAVEAGAVVRGLGRPERVHGHPVRSDSRIDHLRARAVGAGPRCVPADPVSAIGLRARVELAPADPDDDLSAPGWTDPAPELDGVVRHHVPVAGQADPGGRAARCGCLRCGSGRRNRRRGARDACCDHHCQGGQQH